MAQVTPNSSNTVKAVLVAFFIAALASSVSAQEVAMSPAPSPAAGAASSLPIPGILVGFAFILSALTQLRN
ncbi:hypothetical protein L2E82_12585 [Cichorium intybus]|uniref:Uncharacterized protein n=1 Tax=Cichorium intybus TaxID=13427 RepID=A0ACB9GGH4_CICIN|nr:hypothetical protein L2E82_12585 [Cichorium intybus]